MEDFIFRTKRCPRSTATAHPILAANFFTPMEMTKPRPALETAGEKSAVALRHALRDHDLPWAPSVASAFHIELEEDPQPKLSAAHENWRRRNTADAISDGEDRPVHSR